MANGSICCKVVLPSSVDISAREFRSRIPWKTEKWARRDAAFEAYVGLHHVGLINDNLLPLPSYDEEAARAYAKVPKRAAVILANEQYNPWPVLAATWQCASTVYQSIIAIRHGETLVTEMRMISPIRLPHIISFTLHVDAVTSFAVNIGDGVQAAKPISYLATINRVTSVLLQSVFPRRVEEEDQGFLLLFVPNIDLEDLESWLKAKQGIYHEQDVLSRMEDAAAMGLVRERSELNKAYVLHGIERRIPNGAKKEIGTAMETCLKVKKFPKRTDFLHQIPANAPKRSDDYVFLAQRDCQIGRLPVIYSQFATFIPSIMHQVGTALLMHKLCHGLLSPVEFSGPNVIFPAMCAPVAREQNNYQRL